ncbi:MAG: hypothetical protein M3Y54_17975 [Bacteroidota bacterium]|nr:hypothetical protein [Bacteroidota bacterium]
MSRLLALLFTALLLLQVLGPEVLVVSYQLNRAAITARYCVNKARPQLHCNGKCHLARQLRQAEGSDDTKAPAGAPPRVKLEVLPTAAFVLVLPRCWPYPSPAYARPAVPGLAVGRGRPVFRPPLPTV